MKGASRPEQGWLAQNGTEAGVELEPGEALSVKLLGEPR